MLSVVGRMLAAASAEDPVVSTDLAPTPKGFEFALGVFPDDFLLVLRAEGEGRLRVVPRRDPRAPGLTLGFKHIAHAFRMLTFVDGTAEAFAADRVVVDGDVRHANRFLRALDRTISLTLPAALAGRVAKRVVPFPASARIPLALRVVARVARDLTPPSQQ